MRNDAGCVAIVPNVMRWTSNFPGLHMLAEAKGGGVLY